MSTEYAEYRSTLKFKIESGEYYSRTLENRIRNGSAENIQTNSRGENVNTQHLAVLEVFKGEQFYSTYEAEQNSEHPKNPNVRAGRLIETAYQSLKAHVYSELMGQTGVSDLIQLIGLK